MNVDVRYGVLLIRIHMDIVLKLMLNAQIATNGCDLLKNRFNVV